jgi:hypothetical protein
MDQEVIAFLQGNFEQGKVWPKPLNLVQGVLRLHNGEAIEDVASSIRTSRKHLEAVKQANDPLAFVIGDEPGDVAKTRKNLGGLILGRAAELAFEDIYRTEMGGAEFQLHDDREGRTDTDYRMTNGGGRPLYRINIKFFGSTFRRGAELVGLQPHDCFPLATYKIYQAMQKQEREHLPYIFTIVGVPDLNAGTIAEVISEDSVRPLARLLASKKLQRKRDFEDRAVDRIVAEKSPAFVSAYSAIRGASWYVVSARRATNLLRDMMFQRVYALRVRNFAQQFRAAEVDMHYSLSGDLMPLLQFLSILREQGQTTAASMLERGSI